RAVASYVRAIEENESAGEEVDVALFNKVGDLTLRGGRVTEAVTYYERAVEHYVTSGLYDNAIALCNKILRNAPGRSNVYFTLGRICGRKGLRSDATRNFLEYATRMQQEGKIDEGMRGLAEVADLMPELTEVGRLVEEHAARAGIALRRRTTPTRTAAQSAADAPKNLFGMSKDLVFLDIDYDAPRVAPTSRTPALAPVVEARTKTSATHVVIPPPAGVEAVDEQPVGATDDAFAQIEASEIPFIDEVDEDSLFADEAELNAIELEIRNSITAEAVAKHSNDVESDVAIFDGIFEANRVPAALEDLIIFDPTVDEPAIATGGTGAIVDGSSILKPYVDTSTPVPMLPDLEPTEINATAADLQAVAAAGTIPDFLHRGAVDGRSRNNPTPVFVSPIPTLPHLPAIVGAASDTPERNSIFGGKNSHDTIIVGTSNTDSPVVIASDDDVQWLTIESADTGEQGVQSESSNEDPILQESSSGGIVNYAVAQELLATVAIDPLDGFTSEAEEVLSSPEGDITIDNRILTTNDLLVVEDVKSLPGLDVDGSVAQAENAIDRVGDLEVEEFEPSNDSLAHSRFERDESFDATHADSFSAADELPPLIFPMPAHAEIVSVANAADTTEPVDNSSYDEAFNATFDDDFGNGSDVTFDSSLDACYDATFDDAYDSTFDSEEDNDLNSVPESKVELPFLVPEELDNIVFIDNIETEKVVDAGTRDLDNDLDHLFDDGGVPTAVVAAEATLAATSRRDDLQGAVGSEPTNWTLRRRLAEALFEAGERDGAIAELNIALSGFERDEQYVEAAEIADELVRVAGEEVSHHQKRLELAIRMADQNRLRDAYLDLADTFVRRSEDLRAKAVYARVLEIDPWDDRARTALGDAAPPPPARPAESADDQHVNLADWLRDDDEPASTRMRMREPEMSGDEQSDFNSLLRHFKEGVARSLGEEDYDSHYDLGVAYKEMGLLDDAIGEFQKALRSRRYRLAAYEALGQCFLEQQSYKVAVTVLSRALHESAFQEEQRVGVLYLLGFSCEALQRFDEARSYFQRVYATDIHFRDVGQRLADLERITR
ncbi:MAG: tetratricopeptide repeat protein, partial [Gemmatimonadaceae bacterium]